MNNQVSHKTVVNPDQLRQEIQSLLDHRGTKAQLHLKVQDVRFDDGYWQVQVLPSSDELNAGDLADVLAGVEESIFEDHGINTTIQVMKFDGNSPSLQRSE